MDDRQTLLKFCYEAFVEGFFYNAPIDKHITLFNGFMNSNITKEEFETYIEQIKRSKKK